MSARYQNIDDANRAARECSKGTNEVVRVYQIGVQQFVAALESEVPATAVGQLTGIFRKGFCVAK